MGMVIPISHGNLQITNYGGKYRYFTVIILPRMALEFKESIEFREFDWYIYAY